MLLKEMKKYVRLIDGVVYEKYSGSWEPCKIMLNDKYYCIMVGAKIMNLHKVVWMLYHEKDIPDTMCIMHVNGILTDNSIDNLKLIDKRHLHYMIAHRKNNCVGVTKRVNGYNAHITIRGNYIGLGTYPTKEEAAAVYELAFELIDVYQNKQQFYELLYDTYGFYIGPMKFKGYAKNSRGKFVVKVNLSGKQLYLCQLTDEKEAAEFAKLAMKHKAEFVDRQQFLKLLKEKRNSRLDNGM